MLTKGKVILCVSLACIAAMVFFEYQITSGEAEPGQAIRSASNGEQEDLAAVYKEHVITMRMVEDQRGTLAASFPEREDTILTDREITDKILKKIMMQEEAQNRGLSVTEEDIEAFLDSTVYASYETEEGRAIVDGYCEGAGLTFDEYVVSVREAAPSIILKAKLERSIAEGYCKENALVFDERNPSQEIRAMIQEEESSIFEAHKDEIRYYVE